MIYSIKNNDLQVSVMQTGAELCSIKNLKNNREYIWNASPEYWTSHAPVLFPIIGCLKENTYYFKGKSFELLKHGIVRNNSDLKVIKQSESELRFSLRYSEETLKMYPFRFEFIISFTLNENILEINHNIKNLDDDRMYYSLGGHPAFNCPLFDSEFYEDYFLLFDKEECLDTWLLTQEGIVSDTTQHVLDHTNRLNLHKELFENDALIFKQPKSRAIKLCSKNHGDILGVSFDDFNYLGIWAKPGAPFVCIEPWLGIADSVNTNQQLTEKEGILMLRGNSEANYKYAIEVFDI